ncbi:MAG: hypothetical protein ACR2MK_11535 [Solirubrobacteraceae bacterium]
MTPTAITPAARESKPTPARRPAVTKAAPKRQGVASASARAAGHSGAVRRQPAPHSPRRVSGPSRPARRPIGRAKPLVRGPLPARAAAFVRALPDHSLLDRVVRGRAWIPLLGVLLAGIVAMQVEVLKLSASMGRTLERGTQLQSLNEQLRSSVASLADDRRIERLAAGMGLVMPPPEAINFLPAHPGGEVRQALANIRPTNAAGFVASLPAVDTAAGAAATGSTGTTTRTGAMTTTGTGTSASTGTNAGTSGGAAVASSPSSTTPGAATPTGG